MVTSREHWEEVYRHWPLSLVAPDDPVGVAALDHFGDVEGRRLLDLGAGRGEFSVFFASHGARVVALDRSEVAAEALRQACRDSGIDNVEPVAAEAFDIARLGPFDLVFGKFILHHIEPFAEFAPVLRAALAPDGRAYFHENSAMSGLLIWFRDHVVGRFGVPKYGDDDEFPLEPSEVAELRRHFAVEVDIRETYLARLASTYLTKGRLDRPAASVDGLLHRVPALRRRSYYQDLRLRPHPS
ncbi:MAG: class I SAM-dependent methyltransferase [Acidimicrobiia bacterium]